MNALLTDFYQLTMLQAYLESGMQAEAVFELFVRQMPPGRHFLVAAGLEQALGYLETLRFEDDELAWLSTQDGFSPRLLMQLRRFRFTGDVDAMPEGTVFFAQEPILRVRAPLSQAQFVESRLLNLVHFQTMVASKAARCVLAAPGKVLVDFGMRRAHGAEAALHAARAACLVGFAGTATAAAGHRFGLPVVGTMAHAFIQAHESEGQAFAAFAKARPHKPTFLIDTYDTETAARKLVRLAPALSQAHIAVGGVRLDSGDLAEHARAVRRILDEGGLQDATIFASGNLDEYRLAELMAQRAPIDGFGIGTALSTSHDEPSLEAVYKLQSYAGIARRKRSEGKATWPGTKQVYRRHDPGGKLLGDTIALHDEPCSGEPLLRPFMRSGSRVGDSADLNAGRARSAAELARLPGHLRNLEACGAPYPVQISRGIRDLADAVDKATGA
jgi:nicotinate phosphoribosyltransferase